MPASVIGPVKGPRSVRTSSKRRVAGRKRPEPGSAARSSCGLPLEPVRGCGVSLRRGFAMPTGYRLLRPAPKLSLVRISMGCRTRARPPSLPSFTPRRCCAALALLLEERQERGLGLDGYDAVVVEPHAVEDEAEERRAMYSGRCRSPISYRSRARRRRSSSAARRFVVSVVSGAVGAESRRRISLRMVPPTVNPAMKSTSWRSTFSAAAIGWSRRVQCDRRRVLGHR